MTSLRREGSVIARFERRVEEAPGAPAIVSADRTLTRRELNDAANRIARHLLRSGAGPEVRIGVLAERSDRMVIAFLAVLKSGATFVPIDPSYPEERRRFMIEDAGLALLLEEEKLTEILGRTPERAGDLGLQPHEEQGAYLVYTSGSTGRPKGVLVPHRGLLNLAESQIDACGVHGGSQVLQFASPSFDAAISELLMALVSGATLHLAPRSSLLGPSLEELLRARRISVVTLPPSTLATIDPSSAPSLRTVISAGEACPAEVVSVWAGGERAFFNAYGPSEATVCATMIRCAKAARRPSIGRPLPNVEVYVLDPSMRPVSIGETGEIFIGGAGVARGYCNRPELTAAAFVPDPFSGRSGARLYRTGDLGRFLESGELEFLGRIDHQVKVRGHRIELGEIEDCLARHPAVKEAVVVAREHRLLAYFTSNDSHAPDRVDRIELRRHLAERLPEYMLPQAYVAIDAWPLSPNGKVDRARLPDPPRTRPPSSSEYCAPRDELELELVRAWEEVLGIQPIGVHDDFFELGGHSLMAAGLMARIDRLIGRRVPLSALLESRTIDAIAQCMRAGSAFLHRTVVPMRTGGAGGSGTPLFLVHPVGGNVLCYSELVRRLDPAQRVYGIQARGLDPDREPHRSVEEMAAHYLDAMKEVQPHGPYLIAGWSAGGTIAFEMARSLEARGEEIAFLGIIDALSPSAAAIAASANRVQSTAELFADDAKLAYILVRNLERAAGLEAPLDDEHVRRLRGQEILVHALERLRRLSYLPGDAGLAEIENLLRLFKATIIAVHDYRPDRYGGGLALFRSTERHPDFDRPAKLGWEDFAADRSIDVIPVPGNHYTLVSPPHVDVLAAQLEERLSSIRS